jgi:cbb3-type cytochrome oxidase maturation protein
LEIIFITIPVTLIFIGIGAAIFFWASKKGQFDDLDSPAHRILFDDDIAPSTHKNEQSKEQQKDLSKNE